MNDKGYLMMEAVSSLMLLSCLTLVGMPVLNTLREEAAATRQMVKGLELLENRLAMGGSPLSNSVIANKTTFAVNEKPLSDGFVEVCVSFIAANSKEYVRCGLRNIGMNQE